LRQLDAATQFDNRFFFCYSTCVL